MNKLYPLISTFFIGIGLLFPTSSFADCCGDCIVCCWRENSCDCSHCFDKYKGSEDLLRELMKRKKEKGPYNEGTLQFLKNSKCENKSL